MKPYVKGIHLTLDGWRPWRGADGWKKTLEEIRIAGEVEDWGPKDSQKPPVYVKPAPRLWDDIKVLKALTSSTAPPLKLARGSQATSVVFVGGDASGGGYGSVLDDGEHL